MHKLIQLLYTAGPIALGGILNMVWCKLPLLGSLRVPIDGGHLYKDGRRWLGDNKTWKGFVGMPFLTAATAILFGHLSQSAEWAQGLSLIPYHDLPIPFASATTGLLWGLAYVVAELPNSFLKRRIGIGSGKNASGPLGALFVVIDQADSVIGCMLVTPLLYTPALTDALALIALATALHLLINMMLFMVGLKRQPA